MQPRLIHPIPVQIAQIDRSATIYDDRAREPIGGAAHEVIINLVAQIKWKTIGKPDPNFSGPREKDNCYMLFRHTDLAAAGKVLNRGDRVRKIGTREVNMFITFFEDMGHYTDQGGATLMKAWAGDRNPDQQEGDL